MIFSVGSSACTAPTGFTLQAGSSADFSNIATVALGPAIAFATAGVPPGTYYVRVRALNGVGVSPASNELLLIVP